MTYESSESLKSTVLPFRTANGLTQNECNEALVVCYKLFGEADSVTTQRTENGELYVSVSWGDGRVTRCLYRSGGRYVLIGSQRELLASAWRLRDLLATLRSW